MLFDFPRKLLFLQAGTNKLVEDTATGNPLTFLTNAAKPLRSLLIPFTPVQSGTGDPSPENVRPITGWNGVNALCAGENILDSTAQQSIDVNGQGAMRYGQIFRSEGKYTIVNNSPSSDTLTYKLVEKDLSVYGSAVSVNHGEAKTVTVSGGKILYVYAQSSDLSDFCVNVGEDTQFHPFTGQSYPVVFPAMGKNLAKFTAESYADSQKCTYELTETGIEVTATGTYARRLDVFHVVKGQTYTISFKGVCTGDYHMIYFQKAATWNNADRLGTRNLSDTLTDYTFTFVAESDIVAVGCYITATGTTGSMELSDFMLESGDTPHTYEPFTNTVYGGYVDLVTGEVWKTYDYYETTGNENWFQSSSSVENTYRYSFPLPSLDVSAYVKPICDKFKGVAFYNPDLYRISIANNKRVVVTMPNTIEDATQMSEWVESVGGFCFAWLVDNPVLVATLTPQQINALVGYNTIWSDTNGENTVVFLKKA